MQEIAQQRKQVALRKESVDRNAYGRRITRKITLVALRKESVDRNIARYMGSISGNLVALRKESVDRNNVIASRVYEGARRSPQGERG